MDVPHRGHSTPKKKTVVWRLIKFSERVVRGGVLPFVQLQMFMVEVFIHAITNRDSYPRCADPDGAVTHVQYDSFSTDSKHLRIE